MQYAVCLAAEYISFCINILAAISGISLGVWALLKSPVNALVKPFVWMAVTGGLWCLYPTVTSLPLPEMELLFWGRVTYVFAAICSPSFFCLALGVTEFGDVKTRRRLAFGAILISLAYIPLIFHPSSFVGLIRFPHFAPIGGVWFHPFVALTVCYWAGACILVIASLRRNLSKKKRNQLIYFLVAAIILGASPMLHFSGSYLRFEPFPHDFLVPISCGVMAYTILRHELLDIKIVLKRGLVYSVLIAIITATYLVAVILAEQLFRGVAGFQSVPVSLGVAFLVAVFFNPLRQRIQEWIDRAVFHATPAEMADQRDQLLEEVRKSEQMKAVGTLAAGLAHEIKNPLTSIKTFTEYLNEKYDDPGFRGKFQRVVGGEVERIHNIVLGLLEFSKPQQLNLTQVNLKVLLEDTLALMSAEFVKQHIEVKAELADNCWIQGDAQRLKQVFLNLLLNAVEAMPDGGKLTVTLSCQSDEVQASITDTGIGMSPKAQKRAFEPFYSTKTQGTGLGLAVVAGIVKKHDGKIGFSEAVSEGARVVVRFPLCSKPIIRTDSDVVNDAGR